MATYNNDITNVKTDIDIDRINIMKHLVYKYISNENHH